MVGAGPHQDTAQRQGVGADAVGPRLAGQRRAIARRAHRRAHGRVVHPAGIAEEVARVAEGAHSLPCACEFRAQRARRAGRQVPVGHGVAGEAHPPRARDPQLIRRGESRARPLRRQPLPLPASGVSSPPRTGCGHLRGGRGSQGPGDDGECGGHPLCPEHGEGGVDLIVIAIVEGEGDTPRSERRPAGEGIDQVGQRDRTIVAGDVAHLPRESVRLRVHGPRQVRGGAPPRGRENVVVGQDTRRGAAALDRARQGDQTGIPTKAADPALQPQRALGQASPDALIVRAHGLITVLSMPLRPGWQRAATRGSVRGAAGPSGGQVSPGQHRRRA